MMTLEGNGWNDFPNFDNKSSKYNLVLKNIALWEILRTYTYYTGVLYSPVNLLIHLDKSCSK